MCCQPFFSYSYFMYFFFFIYLCIYFLYYFTFLALFFFFLIRLFLKFLYFWHVHFLSLVSFSLPASAINCSCFPCKRQKKIFSRFIFFIFLFSVRPSHLSFVSLSPGNHVVKSQFVRPSICPSVCLSVCLSVRPSVSLSVCLGMCVCPSVRPSVCLSVLPPAGKSNFFLVLSCSPTASFLGILVLFSFHLKWKETTN